MKSSYEHRRDAHIALVNALVELDDAAMQFCLGEDKCSEEACEERGFHVPIPEKEFMQDIERARVIVKDKMMTTLTTLIIEDVESGIRDELS